MKKFELIKLLDSFDDNSEIKFCLTDGNAEYFDVNFQEIDIFGFINLKVNFDKIAYVCGEEIFDWD